MKAVAKDKILELLNTINEAVVYMSCAQVSEIVQVQLLEDCKAAFSTILSEFDKTDKIQKSIFDYADNIYMDFEKAAYSIKGIEEKLQQLYREIEIQIIPQTEILFLPYKYSMWDSLESIWQAAEEDPNCNCKIMPIPYYDKNAKGSLEEFHYEGNEFPMPVVPYDKYSIEKERPDIIYIHYPYDGLNKVTAIMSDYYSNELSKYTKMLVYVPYYIESYVADSDEYRLQCGAGACHNSDRIIVQSEITKEVYEAYGVAPEKLMVLGNPKIDAVYNKCINNKFEPEWDPKLAGKKVFLINSSLTTLLAKTDWLNTVKSIIQKISEYKEFGAIWRPHPLMEPTIKAMHISQLRHYQEILDIIEASSNIILDKNSDLYPAMQKSDGLIGDAGSLIQLFTFTGKPVYSLVDSKKRRNDTPVFCDYFSNYFFEDGDTLEDFFEIVLNNQDIRKEERMRIILNSVANSDGTCGSKIHSAIMNELSNN